MHLYHVQTSQHNNLSINNMINERHLAGFRIGNSMESFGINDRVGFHESYRNLGLGPKNLPRIS